MATYAELLQQRQDPERLRMSGWGNSQENFERGQLNQGLEFGDKVSGMTDTERAFLGELSNKGESADAHVLDEQDRLRQRGDDLSNVDQAYMERAYQPAYSRLMQDYQNLDQGITEGMNKRGILSQGSSADNGTGQSGSEPEAYQRMLLVRDTKRELSNNILSAQNQAVQQKLAQYQGRLAEVNQANERFGQVEAPVIGANVATATDRLNARAGTAGQVAGQKLGYAADMHKTNTTRKMAGQGQILGGVGMGLNFVGDLANAAAGVANGGVKK